MAKAIVNLMAKAVTSPFALLGPLSDGEELAGLEFYSARASIMPMGESKRQALACVLVERPRLVLEIIGNVESAASPHSQLSLPRECRT